MTCIGTEQRGSVKKAFRMAYGFLLQFTRAQMCRAINRREAGHVLQVFLPLLTDVNVGFTVYKASSNAME